MSFECHPDPRCQRGLTFLYRHAADLDPEHLFVALGLAVLRGEQIWGARVVRIWILPKRFELQIGVRTGETRFMHRLSASAQQRYEDKAAFESALSEALA